MKKITRIVFHRGFQLFIKAKGIRFSKSSIDNKKPGVFQNCTIDLDGNWLHVKTTDNRCFSIHGSNVVQIDWETEVKKVVGKPAVKDKK
jgi:hypothetical protein